MGLPGARADKNVGKRKYSSYYSGTDIRIYFGDYWVDEIVEIEFSMQEQVAPIYGYASYTFDKVARGNRIVQGSFSINFKEAGYLHSVLNSLSSKQAKGEWFNINEFDKNQPAGRGTVVGSKAKNIENLIANFDEVSESYELALWGKNGGTNELNNRHRDSFFYGVRDNEKHQTMRDHGFNILITFGETDDLSRGTNNYQTAQTIVGVQLNGLSTHTDPSGNPVQEVYSFIARDISDTISSAY